MEYKYGAIALLILIINSFFDFLSKDIVWILAGVFFVTCLQLIIKDAVKEALEESR